MEKSRNSGNRRDLCNKIKRKKENKSAEQVIKKRNAKEKGIKKSIVKM